MFAQVLGFSFAHFTFVPLNGRRASGGDTSQSSSYTLQQLYCTLLRSLQYNTPNAMGVTRRKMGTPASAGNIHGETKKDDR